MARLIKDNTKFAKKLYDNSIADILKKKRIKEEDIVWEKRPSFIMVMKNPEKPPKFIDDDPTKGLDQPLEFLLDEMYCTQLCSYSQACAGLAAIKISPLHTK